MAQDQITEAQMQARLAKRAAQLKEAAVAKPGGMSMKDDAVIELFGLSETKSSVTINATLTKIRYGVDKNKEDYFSFNFISKDKRALGAQFGPYFSVKSDDYAKHMKRVMFAFQDLGYDTEAWTKKDVSKCMFAAIKELNAKPVDVKLSISIWGDNKDRVDFRVVAMASSTDSVMENTEEETVEEHDWIALGELADTDESQTGTDAMNLLEEIAGKLEVDPNDYATWRSLGEYIAENYSTEVTATDEEEEEPSDEPGPHWVGQEMTWKEYGVTVQVTDCNPKKKQFTVYSPTDEDSYEVGYDDLE